MEWLIKNLSVGTILLLLPMILLRVGNSFKNKDDNETGNDDALGNVLIAAAPAVESMNSSSDSLKKKSFKALYITLGDYLGYPPPVEP
jgi:hypothetical protein